MGATCEAAREPIACCSIFFGDGIAECRQFEIIKTRAADFDATVIKDASEKILNEPHFLNCAELQVVCRAAETTAIDEQSEDGPSQPMLTFPSSSASQPGRPYC